MLRRRDLLTATIGAAMFGCRAVPEDRVGLVSPRASTSAPPRVRTGQPGPIPPGLVGAAQRHTADEALLAAVAHAGGLPDAGSGDVVLLKVNTNSGDPYPYSSRPGAVALLAEHYLRRGAHVVVGDRSFWGDRDTRGNLEANGIAAACAATGAELRVFDDAHPWHELPPLSSWVGPVRIPRLVMQAKVVLNLACVKTHFISGATLGLKNGLGFVRAEDRARPGNLRSHDPDKLHHQIAELRAALPPMFTVLDGYDALVAGGPTPTSGRTPRVVQTGVVLAGRDPVAVDALGLSLLRQLADDEEAVGAWPPWESPVLRAAIAHRLGVERPEALTWRADEGLEELALEASRPPREPTAQGSKRVAPARH
jgi:uncharacterized protein (DUF362 family)